MSTEAHIFASALMVLISIIIGLMGVIIRDHSPRSILAGLSLILGSCGYFFWRFHLMVIDPQIPQNAKDACSSNFASSISIVAGLSLGGIAIQVAIMIRDYLDARHASKYFKDHPYRLR